MRVVPSAAETLLVRDRVGAGGETRALQPVLATHADARAHFPFEVRAEQIHRTRRQALIKPAVDAAAGRVAEQRRNARLHVPAKLLVAVALLEIFDRVDQVVVVERRRAGEAAAEDFLA